MAGWVRVHRKMIESQVFQSERLLKVWVWCLLRSSHSRRWVSVTTGKGKTEVEIMPGQFIFGSKSANKLLKIPQTSITRLLKKLTNIGAIEVKAATHYSIITICNWETYQKSAKSKRRPKRLPNGEATAHQRLPNGEATDTNKNVEEGLENVEEGSKNTGAAAQLAPFFGRIPSTLASDQAFVAAWIEWIKYRRSRRLTVADATITKQLSFLEKLGPSVAAESINDSIGSGWQGLFEPKGKDRGKSTGRPQPAGHQFTPGAKGFDL